MHPKFRDNLEKVKELFKNNGFFFTIPTYTLATLCRKIFFYNLQLIEVNCWTYIGISNSTGSKAYCKL